MSTAHDLLEELQFDGAARFADSGLALDHSALTRRVRRDRAVRTSVTSIAGLAIAGVAAVSVASLSGNGAAPGTSPTPPSASSSAAPLPAQAMSVAKQESGGDVDRDLANRFGVSDGAARIALINALPPEANGDPQGWVLAGEYSFGDHADLQGAADQLVGEVVGHLESANIPRDQWHDLVVLASIIQYEAPTGPSDQSTVARVILNRIDQGMPLMLGSVPNTYQSPGLPLRAIGAATPEALDAAQHPADADWLYYLRKDDGNVFAFSTYEDFEAAVQAQDSN